jgi:hypothetical protein
LSDGSTADGFKFGEARMAGPTQKMMVRRNVYYYSREKAREAFDARLKAARVLEKHEYSHDVVTAMIDRQDSQNPEQISLIEVDGEIFRTFESAAPDDIRIMAKILAHSLETK